MTAERKRLEPAPAGATYVASNAATCLAETSKQSCNGSDDAAYVACDKVFETADKASKALGDPCALTSDCKPISGAVVGCFSNGTALVCEGYIEVRAGEACSGAEPRDPAHPSKVCAEGSSCKAGVCTAKGGSGAACDSMDFDACADGLQCRDAKCAVQPKVGEACSPTEGLACVYPASCVDGVCKAEGGDGCVAP